VCLLNFWWTSRSSVNMFLLCVCWTYDELVDLRDAVDQSMSPILEGIAMSMVAAYNELQCVYQKFVTLFVSLYGSSSQWIAMCIYAGVMPEVCYSICVNNLHFFCLVLQWNVSTDELMIFLMCDTLRFVTRLSFHPFFIHTFKCITCDKIFILHPHRWSKSTTFNIRITSLQHTSLVNIQILHK
jgi:hypothetical protein